MIWPSTNSTKIALFLLFTISFFYKGLEANPMALKATFLVNHSSTVLRKSLPVLGRSMTTMAKKKMDNAITGGEKKFRKVCNTVNKTAGKVQNAVDNRKDQKKHSASAAKAIHRRLSSVAEKAIVEIMPTPVQLPKQLPTIMEASVLPKRRQFILQQNSRNLSFDGSNRNEPKKQEFQSIGQQQAVKNEPSKENILANFDLIADNKDESNLNFKKAYGLSFGSNGLKGYEETMNKIFTSGS